MFTPAASSAVAEHFAKEVLKPPVDVLPATYWWFHAVWRTGWELQGFGI
jgi:hypothetical protein